MVVQPRNRNNGEETFVPSGATQTLEWITVLSAAGLDYRLTRDADGWRLHVPEAHVVAAESEIRAYERERLPPAPRLVPDPTPNRDRRDLWMAFWCAHVLLLFYLWLGPYDAGIPLLAAASANAERIVAGEWWRAATALTLHAGWPHLLGNMLFLFLIGQTVFRALGRGVGLLLLVVAGFLGNLATAYSAAPPRVGVGASTLCFAALGIMSVLQSAEQYRRYRLWRAVWKRAWIPMAAGVALLGMLGTGPQSDLAAHAFGFVAGAALAAPLAVRASAWPSAKGQWALTALAILIPAASWLFAISSLP